MACVSFRKPVKSLHIYLSIYLYYVDNPPGIEMIDHL